MRRTLGPAAVATCVVASIGTGACYFTASFSGLSGGPDDAGAAESGAADAGGDALATGGEGGASLDGGGSAEGGATGCAAISPAPLFCDDFERDGGAGLQGGWNEISQYGGSLAIVPREGGGRELLVKADGVTGSSGNTGVYLLRSFDDVTASTVVWRYSMLVEAVPSVGAYHANDLSIFTTGQSFNNVFANVKADDVIIADQLFPNGNPGDYTEHPPVVPFTTGVRHTVEITLSLAKTPAQLVVHIDGAIVTDANLPSAYVPGRPLVVAGFDYGTAPVGPVVMHVDDVVVMTQ